MASDMESDDLTFVGELSCVIYQVGGLCLCIHQCLSLILAQVPLIPPVLRTYFSDSYFSCLSVFLAGDEHIDDLRVPDLLKKILRQQQEIMIWMKNAQSSGGVSLLYFSMCAIPFVCFVASFFGGVQAPRVNLPLHVQTVQLLLKCAAWKRCG